MKESRIIQIPCTYCGALVKRYPSEQINPKTGEQRKIVKCPNCRSVDPEILFRRFVKTKGHPNGCHEWTGGLNADGYPNFPWPKLGEWRGNRIAWRLANGRKPIPKGFNVLHKVECHNRKCVNPDHLYLGNQSQNMLDAVENGTHPSLQTQGEKSIHAKLTEVGALRILREYRRGYVKQLADELGVSIACVRDVWNRKSWKHLKLPPQSHPPSIAAAEPPPAVESVPN